MQADQYQIEALRTEFTPDFVRLKDKEGKDRSPEHNMLVARAIHACLGLASEVGEIADQLKKHLIYQHDLDVVNILEEIGDLHWYEALMLTATKQSLQTAMERNLRKLQLRFGDKFTTDAATVRDLDAERRILEGR